MVKCKCCGKLVESGVVLHSSCYDHLMVMETGKALADGFADGFRDVEERSKLLTVAGLPFNELIAFAIVCRKMGVDAKDLKAFSRNVDFAIDAVFKIMDENMKRAADNAIKSFSGGADDEV